MWAAGRAFIPSDDSGGLRLPFCFLRAFCVPGDFRGKCGELLTSHPPARLTLTRHC